MLTNLLVLPPPRNFRYARMPFLAGLQDAVCRFSTSRDPWMFAGRKRLRHKELGKLHKRRPRPERIDAYIIVLRFMAAHVQVKHNLRVLRFPKLSEGIPIDSESAHMTIKRSTGISRSRIKDAIADLESMGYLHSYQPRENKPEGYRGRPSVRRFTFKLIKAIKQWGAFKRIRKVLGMDPPRDHPTPAQRYVTQKITAAPMPRRQL